MSKPWERAQQEQASSTPAQQPTQAAPTSAAIVTPASGPPSQEPPKPVVLQNALVGAGTTALTNMMSTSLTNDPDLFKFGVVCNVAAQIAKQHPKFNEKDWTLGFMVVIGIAFCCWYFRDPAHWDLTHPFTPGYLDIPSKGVLDGITAAFQAAMNFHGLAATGVSPLKPVAYERSVEAQSAA